MKNGLWGWLTTVIRAGDEPVAFGNAVKGILYCTLYGAAFGAFLGGVTGGVIGLFYILVGALLGFPIGILFGSAVGAICGLCAGILGGRYGWPLGSGLGLVVCGVIAMRGNILDAPLPLVLLVLFLAGAYAGWAAYQRVWNQTSGIYNDFCAQWRDTLQFYYYDNTTLSRRLIAGWAILGTGAGIVTLIQMWVIR